MQMSLQRGINLRALAEKMGQCSGAEVRGICTEAGMYLTSLIGSSLISAVQVCTHSASGDSMLRKRISSSQWQR